MVTELSVNEWTSTSRLVFCDFFSPDLLPALSLSHSLSLSLTPPPHTHTHTYTTEHHSNYHHLRCTTPQSHPYRPRIPPGGLWRENNPLQFYGPQGAPKQYHQLLNADARQRRPLVTKKKKKKARSVYVSKVATIITMDTADRSDRVGCAFA